MHMIKKKVNRHAHITVNSKIKHAIQSKKDHLLLHENKTNIKRVFLYILIVATFINTCTSN